VGFGAEKYSTIFEYLYNSIMVYNESITIDDEY